jgi:hypothetical protein
MAVIAVHIGRTRTTACIRFADGRVMPVLFGDSSASLPSCVGLSRGNRWAVGWDALALQRDAPRRVAADFLRGSTSRIRIGDNEHDRRALCLEILREVVRVAQEAAQEPLSRAMCVISQDVAPECRKDILDAFGPANLPDPTIIEEPIAEVVGAGVCRAGYEMVVVVRLGERATHLAVVYGPLGRLGLQRTDGLPGLGSDDIAETLANWFLEQQVPAAVMSAKRRLDWEVVSTRLREEAAYAARHLCKENRTCMGPVWVSDRMALHGATLMRVMAEKLCEPFWAQWHRSVKRVAVRLSDRRGLLADTRLLLTGDGAQFPKARRILEETFALSAWEPDVPDLLGALGAAMLSVTTGMPGTTRPEGSFILPPERPSQVVRHVNDVIEDVEWGKVCSNRSLSSYAAFVDRFPVGRHSEDARLRLHHEGLRRWPKEWRKEADRLADENYRNHLQAVFPEKIPFVPFQDLVLLTELKHGTEWRWPMIVCHWAEEMRGRPRMLTDLGHKTAHAARVLRDLCRDSATIVVQRLRRRPLSASVPEGIGDLIHFGITSSPVLQPGRTYMLDVWAFLEHQRHELIQRIRKNGPGERPILQSRGPVQVSRGTALTAQLAVTEFRIEPAEDVILWTGEIGNARFSAIAPPDAAPGPRLGTVTFSVHGVPVSRLLFTLEIGTSPTLVDSLRVAEKRYRRVFASYASEDRDAVLGRIQGVHKVRPDLDVFLDTMSLRSGERWKERCHEEIIRRDAMFLFWSLAASRSSYVDWEWRCALEEHDISFIDPVPLVSPMEVAPPKELASLHFNDWMLAYMRGGSALL